MMVKHINLSVRVGILCLVVMGATACQNPKSTNPLAAGKTSATSEISEETLRKQREAERLQQCQEQLGALRNINAKQFQQYKQAFDSLMSGASQYAGVRTKVNGDTQETVDALYRYKVNFLCAGVNQAVLTGLAERGELVK